MTDYDNIKKIQSIIKAKPISKAKKNKASFDESTPIFNISIIADMLNVHQRTLRIYDEEGILVPQRNEKNRRLYSMNDVEKGRFIQYLTRDLGINLIGVKFLLKLAESSSLNTIDYIPYFQELAAELNISQEEQLNTRQMLLKRGRRKADKDN